jgi:hypothetical protein
MNTILTRVYLANRSKENAAKEGAKTALQEQFKRDIHFLLRRLADPDFARLVGRTLDYTRSGTKKRGIVVERNMKLLARFILEDIAAKSDARWATSEHIMPHSTYAPVGAPVKANHSHADVRSYSRYHELISEFSELLYTRAEIKRAFQGKKFALGRRVEDRRPRVIGTPFSDSQQLPPDIHLLVLMMFKEKWPKNEVIPFLKRATWQIGGTMRLIIADTVEMRKMHLFETYIASLMLELGLSRPPKNGEVDDGRRYLGLVSQILYIQTRTLAELHWFRGLASHRQHALIYTEPTTLLHFDQSSANDCITEAKRWLGSDHNVVFRLMDALEPLVWTNQVPFAAELFRSSLELLQLSDEDKANCLHHLAMVYRLEEKPNLQRSALEEAATLWQQLGGHPGDEAVELAYLAELSRSGRDFHSYESLKSRSEQLASSDQLTLTRRAYITFFLADCADAYEDFVWELKILENGLRIAVKDKSLLGHFEFFDQCINDIKLYGKRGPEWGEGRVPSPPQVRSEAMDGVFSAMYDDPDFGN